MIAHTPAPPYFAVEHRLAQRLGRERWYQSYAIRVAKVERAHGRNGSDAVTRKAV